MGLQLAIGTIRDTLHPRAFLAGNYPAREVYDLLVFVAAVVLSVLALVRRRLPVAYAAWALLMALGSWPGWPDMTRLVIVIFPLFVYAALMLRQERWYLAVVYISTLLLALFTVIFAQAYWF